MKSRDSAWDDDRDKIASEVARGHQLGGNVDPPVTTRCQGEGCGFLNEITGPVPGEVPCQNPSRQAHALHEDPPDA